MAPPARLTLSLDLSMENITLQLPKQITDQGEDVILQTVVLQLYQQNVFTFAQVRRLLNLSVWELQKLLGENQIERHYDKTDLEDDLEVLTQYHQR
jgi:predicted HTH domain antitoxin